MSYPARAEGLVNSTLFMFNLLFYYVLIALYKSNAYWKKIKDVKRTNNHLPLELYFFILVQIFLSMQIFVLLYVVIVLNLFVCLFVFKNSWARWSTGRCARKWSFYHTNKWYMQNPQSVWENKTHKLLWDFDIQTDHLISTRWNRPYNNKQQQKKRTC